MNIKVKKMNQSVFALSLITSLMAITSLETFAAPVRQRSTAPTNAPTSPPPATAEESSSYVPGGKSSSSNSRRSSRTSTTETNYVSSSPRAQANDDLWNEKLFYLFGGIDLGMSMYGAYNNTAAGTSRSGFHGGVRLLGAFYFKKWVMDAGLGWHFISNSGSDPAIPANKVSVITRGSYLEFSPRYRLTQNWQIGPVADYWFTTDNGLNPNALSAVPENTSFWIGVQGLYEWMSDSSKFRLGGRWETSLGVEGRSVNIFQVFFQFGIPLFGGDDQPREEVRQRSNEELNESDVNRAAQYAEPMPIPEATPWPSATPEPIAEATPWPTPEPTPVLKHEAKAKFTITLDVNRLPFETNSARLPRYHMDRLKEIGRFLGEHPKDWNKLIVRGHTDERGSHQYNDNLSKARAQTVRQLLLEGGAPAKKVSAVGNGKRKPRDRGHNARAWAKNRRVEFEFYGVKDVVIINDGAMINPQ